jgi:hypothetical protein
MTSDERPERAGFAVHPAARPTVPCPACRTGLLTLTCAESVPVVRWRYGCPHCEAEVIAAVCGVPPHCAFHRLPPHAYTTTMPWRAGQGPAREGNERDLTVEDLAEYGQPVDVLAELPLGPSPHGQIISAIAAAWSPDD